MNSWADPFYYEVPTAKELGYDSGFGKARMGWDNLNAKKGTPEPIVKTLQEGYKKVGNSEALKDKLKKLNFWHVYMSPEETWQLWEQSEKLLKEGIEILHWEKKQFK